MLCNYRPVIHIIEGIIHFDEEFFEYFFEELIIRFVFKPQRLTIVHIKTDIIMQALAENFNGCGHFFFHDFVILFLLVVGLDSLPGKITLEKINKHIA